MVSKKACLQMNDIEQQKNQAHSYTIIELQLSERISQSISQLVRQSVSQSVSLSVCQSVENSV